MVFILAAPILDAVGDPSIGDPNIGDGSDDVITLRASVCIGSGGALIYLEGFIDSDRCWPIDLRRAPLP